MYLIGDIVRLNARRYPDKKAVTMENRSLTFDELNRSANRLANGLLAMGLKPGDRVALMAYNCLEFPIINYAVAKSGGILVPVNFRFKKDELVYIINNCEPKAFFIGSEFIPLVEDARTDFSLPIHLIPITGGPLESGFTLSDLMEGQSSSEPAVRINPASPACIIYTSWTTGFPKGVLFSHSAFLAVNTGIIFEGDLRPNDITLIPVPLFHNGGLNVLLQPTLQMGGTAVLMGKGFDPDMFLDAISRYKVTLTMCVPTQLAMLVNHPNKTRYDLSTLGKMWYGSSAISPSVLEASMDFFKAKFYQWYGQTESGIVLVLRPEDHIEHSQCTGREVFNADVQVVDEEGNETPVGEVGEIISAQNPLGMIGFHKMEDVNQRIIRNGWIHTEDLARVEGNGYYTVVDRLRDMIISGAENIYSKEVEDVIITHPAVKEVAVFGIPDEVWGEAVCAAVVKKEGCRVEDQEIIDFCASRIGSYKKPRRIVFMNELPKNPTGKVTKNVLREPYWVGRNKRV
jgi:acyl-CoA synthetase (AMP-forming)/AMP-acid ligase II